jgi:hypothetical protein
VPLRICCGKCPPPGEGPDPDEVTLDDVLEALITVEDHIAGIREVVEKLKEQQGEVTITLK